MHINQMEASILNLLNDIEVQNNVTILFAVEAGSRAYGLNSDKSDYDIRFVYRKNSHVDYFTLVPTMETIERPKNDCGSLFDYQGWDIKKAVTHLQESNPSIIEWIYTPISYIDRFGIKDAFRQVAQKIHTVEPLKWHYFKMAKKNWNDYIVGNTQIICKKYFCVIRPVAMLQYFMDNEHSNILIINFDELIGSIASCVPDEVLNEITELSKRKRDMTSTDMCDTIEVLNRWIFEQFERFDNKTGSKNDKSIKRIDKSIQNDTFRMQTLITLYDKMFNGMKKISLLSHTSRFIDKSHYLSTTEFALQFLWLMHHNEVNVNKMPLKLSQLLSGKHVSGMDDVIFEIENIIESNGPTYLQIEPSQGKKVMSYICENMFNIFSKHGIDVPSDVCDKVESLQRFYDGDQTAKPSRHDIIEYEIRHQLGMLWLLQNPKSNISKIPDVLWSNSGLPISVVDFCRNVVTSSMTHNMVSINENINMWLTIIHNKYNDQINAMKLQLIEMRKADNDERLTKSIKHVDKKEFDKLLQMCLFIE
jgi:uncharacterized protein